MHLLRRRRPSATLCVIVFAAVVLLQASTGVVALVARVAAGPPVAVAATSAAAAPVFKINRSGTQLASTKSTSTTTGTIARKGLIMAARSSSSAEVIVVGSCNTDLVTYTPRLPGRGETITGSRFETHHGGKGANQAVMASRLGVRVAMVACLGDDSFGDSYLENLAGNAVDCDSVRRVPQAATGVAQICVEEGGGANFIVIVPGANNLLSPEDVAAAADRLKGANIVMCQSEVQPAATLEALKRGRAAGMTTIFNPAPAQADLSDSFLQLADILCPNETELALLCRGDVDPDDYDSVHRGARELIERGSKTVVVTLGSRGCMLVSSTAEGYRHFPAAKVDATDTVGAGDGFLGSLGAYLARGVALEEAIENAVKVASLTVTRAGAQPSYPRWTDLPPQLRVP